MGLTLNSPNFNSAWLSLGHYLRAYGQRVKTERWQGENVKNDPSAETIELLNVTLSVPLNNTVSLQHWRKDIQPNLPWADRHFEERVCGYPINPGVEWRNWPWGKNAEKFLDPKTAGPVLPAQDWAYLAGMIDGEGTIYFRDQMRWQGVIRVYQRDRSICDYLHQVFRVGKVTSNNEETKTNIHGKEVDNHCFYWQVNAVLEVQWLLRGVLPFLRIKKDKAKEALQIIENSLANAPQSGCPKKLLWGQEWEPRFNHNYMSRYWPRGDNDSPFLGMNGLKYGDLNDLVELLAHEPYTRQAYLPIFFPEDTGIGDGGRKPCTLGYQFIMRNNQLDVYYPMRSCDFARHFRDDCYLTVRLLIWVLEECTKRNRFWRYVGLGSYTMHMCSLHLFMNDYITLFLSEGGQQ